MISYSEFKQRIMFILNSNPLFEMANLSPKQTNVQGGFIFISTRSGAHGCRIKFYPNLSNQSKMLSVSIPDLIIVEDKLGKLISNQQRKEVIQFAKIFSKELEDFWKYGNTWDDEKVTGFKATLKLTTEQLADASSITIKRK